MTTMSRSRPTPTSPGALEALPASQLPARLHIEYVAVDPPAGSLPNNCSTSALLRMVAMVCLPPRQAVAAHTVVRSWSTSRPHWAPSATSASSPRRHAAGCRAIGRRRAALPRYAGLLRDRIQRDASATSSSSPSGSDLPSQFGLSKAVAIYCRTPQPGQVAWLPATQGPHRQ